MITEDWGLIEYAEASVRQLELVDRVANGGEDTLVFCTHPSVVTLGRGSTASDLIGWTGAVAESSRGGRATYHGPGQIVIYPIVDLRRRGRDVHAYLRWLEACVVEALNSIGVAAVARETVVDASLSVTGVWVESFKIASIGIAVRKWITYHGVALNVTRDDLAFSGIKPCGFNRDVMTSMEELGVQASLADVKAALAKSFTRVSG